MATTLMLVNMYGIMKIVDFCRKPVTYDFPTIRLLCYLHVNQVVEVYKVLQWEGKLSHKIEV